MEREDVRGEVIAFPGYRLGTIAETMAGFRGPATPDARRREGRVTVLEVDLRGFSRVADAIGRVEADRLLAAVSDRALHALTPFRPHTVSVAGEPAGPVIAATFEGPDHGGRALGAATAMRDAADATRPPGLPGFQACAGI